MPICLLAAAWPWPAVALAFALVALIAAWGIHATLSARSDGDETARALAAQELDVELRALASVARIVAGGALLLLVVLLSSADSTLERLRAWGFVLGATLSLLAASIALRIGHGAAARAAEAARTTLAVARETVRDGANVVGLAAAGLALLGTASLWLVGRDPRVLFGLALGASAVALLVRTGTPGGTAARGAELLEACTAALVAAIAAAVTAASEAGTAASDAPGFVAAPLALGGASWMAALAARGRDRERSIALGGFVVLALLLLAFVDREPLARLGAASGARALGSFLGVAGAFLAGAAAAVVAERTTAEGSERVARPVLPVLPVLLGAAAAAFAHAAAGRYGLGLAALGAASSLRIPAAAPPARATAPGAGTVVAAALAASVLFVELALAARIVPLDLVDPTVLCGLLVGAAIPFVFAASVTSATSAPREGIDRGSTLGTARAMIAPASIAIGIPLAVGALNGAALGGLLAGTIASGIVLALVERAAGPPLGVLVKLMSLVALVVTRR